MGLLRRDAIQLPDCRAREPGFTLSARQRREVVEALARGGDEALEHWLVQEEKRDPYIRRRIHEEHDRLQREAREERARIESRYAKARGDRETAWERHVREVEEREARLRERIEAARAGPTLDIEELARSDPLYAAALGRDAAGTGPGTRSVWGRVWDALRMAGWFIVLVWVRFVRGIKRLFGVRAPEPTTTITLPDGMRLSLGAQAALRPGVMARIRYRMREERGMRARLRRMADRLLGREDYAEIAAKIMAEDMARQREERQRTLHQQAEESERQLRDLARQEREERRRHQEEMDRLHEQEEKEVERLSDRLQQGPYEAMRDELLGMLADSGLVDARGRPTDALMQRFSGILLDEAMRMVPAGGESEPGHYVEGEGDYEKGPLRSLNERGAMELVDSVVQARLHHPRVRHLFDEDLLVHREVRTTRTHVVIIVDRSGSMEEQGRMEAAKTVALVLFRAIKEENPDHRVDLLMMSTGIEHVDLGGCWNAEPGGFTNHGRALRDARLLFEEEDADRRLVYLITDGLPEAMTDKAGNDFADRPDVCMPFALDQARRLRDVEGLHFLMIQLESEDERFIAAAREIAAQVDGRMEVVEPEALTHRLLRDYRRQGAVRTEPA